MLLAGAAPSVVCLAQAPPQAPPGPLSAPPKQWAQDCVNHEAELIQHTNSYLRFRIHIVDEKGEHVRDEIETPQGTVARLIERNGKPLTSDEDHAERARLQALMDSPSIFARHVKSEDADKKMGVELLKLMPVAMVWSYAPGQPQPPGVQGTGGDALVVLDFTPDPKWNPPTIPAEALTGLVGRVWIDPHEKQVVRLEGKLVKAVNVGWGVVAHLYPGGTIVVQQRQVNGDRWIAEHVVEQLVVRALMVKTIRQDSTIDTSEYQAVPSMSYQQAIKTLLDTPLRTESAER